MARAQAAICFGHSPWGRGHTGGEGPFPSEAVGEPGAGLEEPDWMNLDPQRKQSGMCSSSSRHQWSYHREKLTKSSAASMTGA